MAPGEAAAAGSGVSRGVELYLSYSEAAWTHFSNSVPSLMCYKSTVMNNAFYL